MFPFDSELYISPLKDIPSSVTFVSPLEIGLSMMTYIVGIEKSTCVVGRNGCGVSFVSPLKILITKVFFKSVNRDK